MLLKAGTSARQEIIYCLAQKGKQKVTEIQRALEKKGIAVTIQGIYRALRELQKDGAAIRERHTFSLRISWILDLAYLVDEMETTYLHQDYLTQLLPTGAGQRVWYFTDLLKMNDFWSQLLIAMATTHQKAISLNFVPHRWFELMQRNQESQFKRAFCGLVTHEYSLIGSQSFLDRYVLSLAKKYPNEHVYVSSTLRGLTENKSQYIDILGDFILTITLSRDMSEEIERLFASIKKVEDIRNSDILAVFTKPTKIKITLKKDAKKAAVFYKKFERIFGPLR